LTLNGLHGVISQKIFFKFYVTFHYNLIIRSSSPNRFHISFAVLHLMTVEREQISDLWIKSCF
jgi:hypothetical protein